MKTKSSLRFFVFLFPIMVVVGILISLAYSLRFHESPGVDWIVVFVAALVLDAAFTWFNRKDYTEEKKEH